MMTTVLLYGAISPYVGHSRVINRYLSYWSVSAGRCSDGLWTSNVGNYVPEMTSRCGTP